MSIRNLLIPSDVGGFMASWRHIECDLSEIEPGTKQRRPKKQRRPNFVCHNKQPSVLRPRNFNPLDEEAFEHEFQRFEYFQECR